MEVARLPQLGNIMTIFSVFLIAGHSSGVNCLIVSSFIHTCLPVFTVHSCGDIRQWRCPYECDQSRLSLVCLCLAGSGRTNKLIGFQGFELFSESLRSGDDQQKKMERRKLRKHKHRDVPNYPVMNR